MHTIRKYSEKAKNILQIKRWCYSKTHILCIAIIVLVQVLVYMHTNAVSLSLSLHAIAQGFAILETYDHSPAVSGAMIECME